MSATFDSVSFTYPESESPALREVSLAIQAGEISWVFGRLGAGASTLLLVASGLAPRHTGGVLSGQVRILGADPAADPSLHGRTAYVTASPRSQLSQVAETVAEEVAFAPANLGWPRDRIWRAVEQALEETGVADLAGRHPGELSGGQLQRVVLAAMMALEPMVWILDEPASAMDHAGQAMLFRFLRTRAAAGATVLIATEDADAMVDVADRLIVLAAGTPVLDGEPKAVLAGDDVWHAAGGSTTLAALARQAGALRAAAEFAPPYPTSVAQAVDRWRR